MSASTCSTPHTLTSNFHIPLSPLHPGYVTSPETLDKKALKLARRRILFNFAEREENQEALYGFRSGLVLSIPAPR